MFSLQNYVQFIIINAFTIYKCLYNVCGKLHLLKRDYKLVIIFSKLWRDDSM